MTYTEEDLKGLPLRAIVAFAARCARRVEHLAVPPGDGEARASAVAEALRVAEDFARGRPCPTIEDAVLAVEAGRGAAQGDIVRENAYEAVVRAAHAAATAIRSIAEAAEPPERPLISGGPPVQRLAHLTGLSAELAALGAYTAAVDAAEAQRSTDGLTEWAAEDYRKLKGLDLGRYPDAGQPIDPSPEGPLGPLQAGSTGP